MSIKGTPAYRVKEARRGRVWRRENPDKSRAASRNYYRKHRETCIARNNRWKKANAEKRKADAKTFVITHPTYFRDYQRKRRMAKAWIKWTRRLAESRWVV